MSFPFLGPLHPQIVHTPVALLIFSAFFAIVGLLFDRDWLRKASVVMLVFGCLGAFAAVQSGERAERVPERQQGVPEKDIESHSDSGERTFQLAGGALVAMFLASRLKGRAATVVSGLALLLQIGAAVMVGVAGYRGGRLVYEHGANVHVDGVLIKSVHAGERADPDEKPAPADEAR